MGWTYASGPAGIYLCFKPCGELPKNVVFFDKICKIRDCVNGVQALYSLACNLHQPSTSGWAVCQVCWQKIIFNDGVIFANKSI